MPGYQKAILFYNTESGHSKKGRQLDTIKAHFEKQDIFLSVVQFPKPGENIRTTLDQVPVDDADLLIAAGGDGTVSLISNKAINTEKTLGVIPLGTGNLLAQELKIPINLEKALNLITADNPKTFLMDTIKLDDRCCLLNVSAGLSPKVMKSTQSKEKQRYGLMAYIVNFVKQFLGLKRHRFFIDYDDHNLSFVASEVLITNGGSAGVETLKLSDNIELNDGQLDLFIIRAKNFYDVINLVISLFSKKNRQSSIMKHVKFSKHCRIETQTPLSVQADGDTIGETPIEIKVLHESLRVIIGENYEEQKTSERSKK
jgi:YegS/Rv2252/BmrU family lipid kinase